MCLENAADYIRNGAEALGVGSRATWSIESFMFSMLWMNWPIVKKLCPRSLQN